MGGPRRLHRTCCSPPHLSGSTRHWRAGSCWNWQSYHVSCPCNSSSTPSLVILSSFMMATHRLCDTPYDAAWACCPAQVCRLLKMAMRAGPLCLPRLAKIALFLKGEDEDVEEDEDEDEQTSPPVFTAGPAPVPPDHSGPGVCNALGSLVTAGVLPALAQACLSVPQLQRHLHIPEGCVSLPSRMQLSPYCCMCIPAGPAVPLQTRL